jgi:hypothetical protein
MSPSTTFAQTLNWNRSFSATQAEVRAIPSVGEAALEVPLLCMSFSWQRPHLDAANNLP